MPWEITIRRSDRESLGDLDTVRREITAALPGVEFYSERGDDILASLEAGGVEIDRIRGLFESKILEKALFEGDGYSFEFYGLEDQPLNELHVEVRGGGNPISALAALCCPNGWTAIDDTSGEPIDLGSGSAAGWNSFRAYVGRAVRVIMSAEDE
jgi:hypothetical protein